MLYLAKSDYVTGTATPLDGGFSAASKGPQVAAGAHIWPRPEPWTTARAFP